MIKVLAALFRNTVARMRPDLVVADVLAPGSWTVHHGDYCDGQRQME